MRYTVNSCAASAGSGDTKMSTAGINTMKVRGNEDLNMLSNTSLASSNIVANVYGTQPGINRVALSSAVNSSCKASTSVASRGGRSTQAYSKTTLGKRLLLHPHV